MHIYIYIYTDIIGSARSTNSATSESFALPSSFCSSWDVVISLLLSSFSFSLLFIIVYASSCSFFHEANRTKARQLLGCYVMLCNIMLCFMIIFLFGFLFFFVFRYNFPYYSLRGMTLYCYIMLCYVIL